MSKKLPAMQFYPGDWLRDPGVRSLTYEQRGVWFEMLCHMHESEQRGYLVLNGRPQQNEDMARMLSITPKKLAIFLEILLEKGVASKREDGAIFNRRMVRDEQIRQMRAEGGASGAEFGQMGAEYGVKGAKHGKKGGRPKACESFPDATKTPPLYGEKTLPLTPALTPAPSSSSSSSSSSSEGKDSCETVKHGSPEQAEAKPKKTRARTPRDDVFDAICDVTGAMAKTNASQISKLVTAFMSEEPPVTPDEIRQFGYRFHEFCPWAAEDGRTRPTIGELGKQIGNIRAAPAIVKPVARATGRAINSRPAAEDVVAAAMGRLMFDHSEQSEIKGGINAIEDAK